MYKTYYINDYDDNIRLIVKAECIHEAFIRFDNYIKKYIDKIYKLREYQIFTLNKLDLINLSS